MSTSSTSTGSAPSAATHGLVDCLAGLTGDPPAAPPGGGGAHILIRGGALLLVLSGALLPRAGAAFLLVAGAALLLVGSAALLLLMVRISTCILIALFFIYN